VNYYRLKSELRKTSKVNLQNLKSELIMIESTPKREDFTMTQVHKRFTAEQVRILFQGYCQGNLSRPDIEEMLGIGKTRFFALLKSYRQDASFFDHTSGHHGRLEEGRTRSNMSCSG
jgi:hypothetical protein